LDVGGRGHCGHDVDLETAAGKLAEDVALDPQVDGYHFPLALALRGHVVGVRGGNRIRQILTLHARS
jgi:hypothetical protein